MARTNDRRVQRTQQLLRSALFALIQERGFERISVQDIIDRANVGRATFYAHFDNKEDLLLSGFEDLRAALRSRQREALLRTASLDQRLFAFSRDLLRHVDEHRHLIRARAGKRSGAVAQAVLLMVIIDLVGDDLKAIGVERNSPSAEVAARFIAGGLFGMLTWWLEAKPRPSVQDLDADFRRFALPAAKVVSAERELSNRCNTH